MENTKIPTPEEVKLKVQRRLELDKGKSLDEIYHDEVNHYETDRLYNMYLKMEESTTWNR